MQFSAIVALAVAALAFVSADSEVKHKPHHRHHSSSSSSSSDHGCACTEAEAIKEVKRMQKSVEMALITDNTATFSMLSTNDFSYALNVRSCMPPNCCFQLGDKASFMDYYSADDRLVEFFYNQPNYIKRFHNGTIVVNKTQIRIPAEGDNTDTNINFYYSPTSIRGCEFKLSYVDGNSLGCPTFQQNLPECMLCDKI